MDEQEFFDQTREIWGGYPRETGERIIPLCTAGDRLPDDRHVAIVIGINHSVFTPRIDIERDHIAQTFSERPPLDDEHTYVVHNHNFATQLRGITASVEVVPTIVQNELETGRLWVGTNRCPIQTGPSGTFAAMRSRDRPLFNRCQSEMDELLRDYVRWLRPERVILFGTDTVGLYFDGRNISDLQPRGEPLAPGLESRLIPVWHPSRHSHLVVERLRECWNW